MNGIRILRALIAASIVAFVLAGAFGAYELVRPGCSLFPVALPMNDPNSGAAAGVGRAEVCAFLGRPMPHITMLPAGVREDGISYTAPPGVARGGLVTVSYVRGHTGVALLEILRQNGIPVGNQSEINGTIQGAPAIVTEPYSLPPGVPAVMSYLWSRDGLLYTLHVRLDDEIDRSAADAMAESVR